MLTYKLDIKNIASLQAVDVYIVLAKSITRYQSYKRYKSLVSTYLYLKISEKI